MWGNKNILDNYDLYLEYEKRQRRRSEEELETKTSHTLNGLRTLKNQ